MRFYSEEREEVLGALQSGEEGLTSAEAEKRMAERGPNRLAAAKGKSLLRSPTR